MRAPLVLIVLAACGGGSSRAPDAGPSPDGGGCEAEELHATFRFDSHESGYASLYGVYMDRPSPAAELVGATAGPCVYVRPGGAFCDPVCQTGVCVGDPGACVPYPEGLAMGTLHTTGTTPELAIEASFSPGSYATSEGMQGWYQPGDTIGIRLEGDVDPALELATVAVDFVTLSTTQYTATEHQPMTLTWTAGDAHPGDVVVVQLNNDHHGINSYVRCTAPASAGSLTVEPAVLDPLIEDGETGIGTYIENATVILRHRSMRRTARGCAAVDSESQQWITVDVVRP
jgi:hypothetical protein